MRQFTLNLNQRYQRPLVEMKSWNNTHALLDTGAVIPIWTGGERILEKLGGKLRTKNVLFGGFGGETRGNLYILPSILIGGLIFPNLPTIASDDLGDVPFYMILSATMFSGLIYEIDDLHHKLNVTIPDGESVVRNLTVKDSHGRLHVLCESGNESGRNGQRRQDI